MLTEVESLKPKSTVGKDARRNVVEAAIKCFERYGPQRTSMEDIAEEADISRKTLYRIFDDRPTLIGHILQLRMYALAEKMRRKLAQYDDFEQAMIEGSIYAIRISKADKLFNDIITNDTNHRLEQFIFAPRGQHKTNIVDLYSDVISKGREKGLVRTDLSDERIAELIGNVHGLLLIHDDYDEADQRAYIVDFLLPALRPIKS